MSNSKYLNLLEYLLAIVVFGAGGVWAHGRDAAKAASDRYMITVYKYRSVAACIDEAYIAVGETLADATSICELDPQTYPRTN
jgi:hypothetical protein